MRTYPAGQLSDTAFAEPLTWGIYAAGMVIGAVELIVVPLLRKLNKPRAAKILKTVCDALLIPVGILILFEVFFG